MIRKDRAKSLRERDSGAVSGPTPVPAAPDRPGFTLVSPQPEAPLGAPGTPIARKVLLRVKGPLPAELWNRFGSKIVPKLRSAENLQASVELTVEVASDGAGSLESDLRQVLADLELNGKIAIEKQML